jgi:hypothetical protein
MKLPHRRLLYRPPVSPANSTERNENVKDRFKSFFPEHFRSTRVLAKKQHHPDRPWLGNVPNI